ncbi:OCIA domain-containing protein 1-like [Uloborus diversus]|uniref:OCIA domain-containing protein 1-like n=1 Tax=Uloborus diversus TaxID=327109 RepID=UPI00240972C8|nr:OCIA domain-containing protein 1-like [Uloborus diversus]
METGSPVPYNGTSESRFQHEENQKKQLQLTPEEVRVLQECNKESFYYRCLPFAMVGMAGTFFAVRNGYLSSHPKWGPSLKMTGAAFVGWILGKFSYRKICEEKFLHVKNGQIANAIRKKRGLTTETFDSEISSTTYQDDLSMKDDRFTYFTDKDYHSSLGSLNLDTDKNIQYSGLDDRERPSTDRENQMLSEDIKPTGKIVTYDELRIKNREEYERQSRKPQAPQSSSGPQRPWASVDPPKRYNEPAESSSRNVYGDSWDSPKFN